MARHTFTVAGRFFASALVLKSHVREVIERAPLDTPMVGEDADLFRDLIDRHPRASIVIGSGIASIYIGSGAVRASERSLYVLRTDGSREAVSWNKCISGENRRTITTFAFRHAVRDQTNAARREGVNGGARCAITGEKLEAGDIHVDHVPPFIDRLTAFLGGRGLAIEGVLTRPIVGGGGHELEDAILESDWKEYHRTSGTLRIISVAAHKVVTSEQARQRCGKGA